MNLQLTNTLTRRKEPFVPRDEGRIGIYLCGVTVYSEPHIGNLRNVVVFDVLRRHLVASGYDVLFVRNITDVDDKIIAAAGHDPLRAFVVAEHWTRVYDEVTAALGTLPPDIAPRASGHIPEMLALIAKLLDNGLAYQAGGDVFFSVGKWPDYGKLSGHDLAELRSGARIEVNPDKRDPLDFVLWKGAKPGEPSWWSPWGPGRPGWHIECSAMSAKYLGPGFDIHGGGQALADHVGGGEVARRPGPLAQVEHEVEHGRERGRVGQVEQGREAEPPGQLGEGAQADAELTPHRRVAPLGQGDQRVGRRDQVEQHRQRARHVEVVVEGGDEPLAPVALVDAGGPGFLGQGAGRVGGEGGEPVVGGGRLLEHLLGEVKRAAVVGAEQRVAQHRPAVALQQPARADHVPHRLGHLLALELQVGVVQPVAGEALAGGPRWHLIP